jgi:peptide/nickel transport system substrate-binding protein
LVTTSYATYLTHGVQNNGHYSNPEVDLLLKQLYSEINPDSQQKLLARLDATLWSDLATMPLFAFPAVLAAASNLQGVQYNPNGSDVTYNANDWTLK